MKTVGTNIEKSDIILFKTTKENLDFCQLKNFINYLHFNKLRRPFKFSYVPANAQLINTLTLKENILLDSIPTTLSKTKEFQLNNHLKKTGNVHLIRLFKELKLLDIYPNKTDLGTQKIIALLKGLIQESNFLFLEKPELHLSDDILETTIKAIEYQAINTGQTVLFTTENQEKWLTHVSKIVTIGEKHLFHTTPVLSKKLRDKYLGKKETIPKSTTIITPEVSTTSQTMPEKIDDKKSAQVSPVNTNFSVDKKNIA